MNDRRNAGKALHVFLVAVFAAAVGLAGLWSLPPLDRDESRFAQATAQMLETGDYVSIRFQDAERNKKPAGIHWLQAASVSAFSSAEAREIWAYRIPSFIGVVLAAVFTYLSAARLYDAQTGLLAGLLLAGAPAVVAEGTIAKTDGMLLAMTCLAQLAFIHVYARFQEGRADGWGWPAAFWAAQGASILVKGPITPMVSVLTGLGLALRAPRFSWIRAMRPVGGVLLAALIAAPWIIAIGLATEGRFFIDAIGGDMLGKVGEAQERHAGPPSYHAGLVWALFWPAAALILPGLIGAWRERDAWQARFLLSWLIPSWIVFELAATKLPHYTLPLYPALAIMAARAAIRDEGESGFPQRAGAVLYAGVGLLAAGLIIALSSILREDPMMALCYVGAALIAAASLIIATLFWRGRSRQGAVAAAILAGLYGWVVMVGVLPGLSQLSVSPQISAALETAGRHPLHDGAAPVALAGYNEPSAVFLLGTQTMLTSGGVAGERLLSGAVSAAVVESRMEAAFQEAIAGREETVRPLATISGLNYSNGRSVSLTVYVRAAADP